MQPTIKTSSASAQKKLLAALQKIVDMEVYVGISDKTAKRKGEKVKIGRVSVTLDAKINNSTLMHILTNGSLINNIPPIPILQGALQYKPYKKLYTAELELAAKAVLDGDPAEAKSRLNKAGESASNSAKRWFVNPANGWPANAESTIRRKGSSRRNINIGEMRKAITWVVA